MGGVLFGLVGKELYDRASNKVSDFLDRFDLSINGAGLQWAKGGYAGNGKKLQFGFGVAPGNDGPKINVFINLTDSVSTDLKTKSTNRTDSLFKTTFSETKTDQSFGQSIPDFNLEDLKSAFQDF
jgi:hypothetical protein